MWLTIFRNTIMLSQTKPMLHVACDASSQATVLCSPPPRMDTRIERSLIVRNTTRTITLLTRSRPPSLHKSQMPRKMLLHCPPNNAPARARIAPLLLLPLLGTLCQTVRIIAAAAAAAAAATAAAAPAQPCPGCVFQPTSAADRTVAHRARRASPSTGAGSPPCSPTPPSPAKANTKSWSTSGAHGRRRGMTPTRGIVCTGWTRISSCSAS